MHTHRKRTHSPSLANKFHWKQMASELSDVLSLSFYMLIRLLHTTDSLIRYQTEKLNQAETTTGLAYHNTMRQVVRQQCINTFNSAGLREMRVYIARVMLLPALQEACKLHHTCISSAKTNFLCITLTRSSLFASSHSVTQCCHSRNPVVFCSA